MPSVMTCHLCGGGVDISEEASRGVCGPVASINLHCQQCGAAFQGRDHAKPGTQRKGTLMRILPNNDEKAALLICGRWGRDPLLRTHYGDDWSRATCWAGTRHHLTPLMRNPAIYFQEKKKGKGWSRLVKEKVGQCAV